MVSVIRYAQTGKRDHGLLKTIDNELSTTKHEPHGDTYSRAHVKPAIKSPRMHSDRVEGRTQLLSNLRVRQATANQTSNLLLAPWKSKHLGKHKPPSARKQLGERLSFGVHTFNSTTAIRFNPLIFRGLPALQLVFSGFWRTNTSVQASTRPTVIARRQVFFAFCAIMVFGGDLTGERTSLH